MKKLRAISIVTTVVAGLMSVVPSAMADKLEDITSSGKIRIGVLLDAAPWGFKGADGKDTGLDVALAELMAKDLNADLELVPLTGQSRIPSLLADKIDVMIAATGATPERAQQVMFSQPYAAVNLGVYGAKGTARTENVADLAGKQVAVAKGSTLDVWLTDNAPDVKVVRFEDTPAAIAAYLAGQVEMFAENSAISVKVSEDNPDKATDLVFLIRQSPAHVAVKQGEQNLLNWVNTFIFYNKLSGKLGELQEEFFKEKQDLPNM